MITKNTIKNFLIAFVILASLCAVTAYVWLFLTNMGEELAINVQKVRDQDFLSSELIKLERQLESTATQRVELDTLVLAGESGAVDFLSEMDAMANRLGVSLETEELNVFETEEVGFDELHVKFSLSGTDAGVMNFVKVLENLPYSSRVSGLTLSRTAATGLVTADVTVKLSISTDTN